MTKEIIPTFPQHEHAKLFAAAHTFRMPYWDFAAKKTRDPSKPASYYIPLIVLPKRIRVVTSMGEKDIDNPMYKFTTPEPMGKYGIVPMQIPCEESPVQSIPVNHLFLQCQNINSSRHLPVRSLQGDQSIPVSARPKPDRQPAMGLWHPK